jgi:hypothetical protein
MKIRGGLIMRREILNSAGALVMAIFAFGFSGSSRLSAHTGKKPQDARVCSDPSVPCRTSVTFEAHDLPFQVPRNVVIWETVEFYAVILQSVASPEGECERFVSEEKRLEAQSLFPRQKVFASRPCNPGGLFYMNVAPDQQFMAVYAGATKTLAEQTLAKVKATGKYPGANIRRMRAGFNGT